MKTLTVLRSLFAVLLSLAFAPTGWGQVSLPAAGYIQSFDSMGTSGTAPPTGWSHIGVLGGDNASWGASIPVSGAPSAATAGTANNTLIVATGAASVSSNTQGYNFGASGNSDRALGTSPTTGTGNILQLRLTNNTGVAVSAIRIGYEIRRFRVGSGGADSAPGYWMFFSTDGGTSWTEATAFRPTITTVPNTVGISNFGPTLLNLGSSVANGSEIRLRWVDDNGAASSPDTIIGLDDVSIAVAPTVTTTTPATAITTSTATAGGNITATGGVNATIRGVEFSTTNGFANGSGTPVTESGSFGTGAFTRSLTGLSANTVYYYKAFATNPVGTAYGAQGTFTTTAPAGTITTGGTVTARSTIYGTASSEASFTVSGTGLTGNLTVTPPAGFETSLTAGSGYGATTTITASGTLASTTVYVRLAAATAPGTFSGNIVVSGGGASSQNVAIPASTVSVKPLTLTGAAVTSKPYDGTNAATITGTLSGINGSDVVTFTGTGTFASVNIDTGISVTAAIVLTGADATRYSITQPVALTGNITLGTNTITFGALAARTTGDAPFALTATASSGLAVTYASSNTAVATVSGSTLTILTTGTTTITASQAGNSSYAAAAPVDQVLTVSAGPTTLTAGDLAFTAFQSDNSGGSFAGDAFEFVLLVPVTTGTTVYFTDCGYRTDVSRFRTNENMVRWVAQSNLPAGTVKQFINTGGTGFTSTAEWTGITPSTGVTLATATLALATNGDNIAAIQNPTFASEAVGGTAIAQVTFGGATFASTFTTGSGNTTSGLAAGLTDGVNAISLAATDNGRYDASISGSVESGTLAQVRSSINTDTNWQTSGTPFTPGGSNTTFTVSNPSIVTTGTVTARSTNYGTPSTAASFTVSGTGLTGNLTVTPPAGFETSLTVGSGYGATTTITASGTLASTTVYVRLAAATAPGSYSGNVVVSGGGASSQNVAIPSSTVSTKELTLSSAAVTSKEYDTNTAATITGTLSGIVSPDVVTFTGTGTFATATPGTGIAVTAAIVLTGADAARYTIAQPIGLTGEITKLSQTITFAALPGKTTADVPFSLTATASSGLAVSYLSSDPLVASISGNTVTLLAGGSTVITASQPGNAIYSAATDVPQTLTVSVPTIALGGSVSALTATYGTASTAASFTVSGTFLSGDLTVTPPAGFETSLTAGSGYGATTTITASGTLASTTVFVRLAASNLPGSYSGNIGVSGGSATSQNLVIPASTVSTKELTLTGAAVTTKPYDTNTDAVITGTLSGIVGADVVTFTGTGTFATATPGTGIAVTAAIVLTGADAARYTIAQPIGLTGEITKLSQTITFAALPGKTTADVPFSLTATASSGLAVSYLSSDPLVASISGNTVTLLTGGSTTITASQPGNAIYSAATDVPQTLTVNATFDGQFDFAPHDGAATSFAYNGTTIPNVTVSAMTIVGATPGNNDPNLQAAWPNTGTLNANGAANSALVGSPNTGAYFQYTLTADAGYVLSNPKLRFGVGRELNGPRQFQWRSSVDGFAAPIAATRDIDTTGTGTEIFSNEFRVLDQNFFTPDPINGTDFNEVSLTTDKRSSLTFRFYAYGAEANSTGARLTRFLNFLLDVTPAATALPSAPTITGITANNNELRVAFTAPAADGGSALTSYDYSVDGGLNWIATSPALPSSPLVITGLTNGQAYPVQLRARNANGIGDASSIVSGTPQPNTITGLAATDTRTINGGTYALIATASSGLPVSYQSSDTNVATISGSNVSIVGAGTTTLTASQAGDGVFAAAANVTQTLTVLPSGWTLMENYEARTPGSLNAQNNWSVVVGAVGGTGTTEVTADPADPGNKVATLSGTHTAANRFMSSLSATETFTVFKRFRLENIDTSATSSGEAHLNMGVSNLAVPSGPGDFSLHTSVTPTVTTPFRIRHTPETAPTNVTVTSDIWYSSWYVVNNSTGRFKLYIQGGAQSTPVLAADGTVTDGNWNFRNAGAITAARIYLRTLASHNAPAYVDDIYFAPGEALFHPFLPTLATGTAGAITRTTATISGNEVTNAGASAITERGVVFSTTANPTIADTKVVVSGTTGSFNANLTGLALNTPYFVRTFATNAAGTAYGADVSFTTLANNLPAFSGMSVSTVKGSPVNILFTKILAKSSDADADTVTITDVTSPTAGGGTVILGATAITYTPEANFSGSDTITFTLGDGIGTINHTIAVTVTVDPLFTSAANGPTITPLGGGAQRIAFFGIPGRTYAIQRSTTMAPGSWTQIAAVTTAANSTVTFDDPTPPQPSAFYRIAFPAQ